MRSRQEPSPGSRFPIGGAHAPLEAWRTARRESLLVALALALVACGASEEPSRSASPGPGAPAAARGDPPRARLDLVRLLREDLATPRHPADGQGRAWIEPDPARPSLLEAGQVARFSIVFEVGPRGIAEGGAIFLQPSPFWGWSAPQTEHREVPGYTRVTTEADGVSLVSRSFSGGLLQIGVRERGLRPGERVRLAYGAGPSGARVDRFAEHDSRLWIAVDGDGDGVRQLLEASPSVDIGPGPPARLELTLPTVLRPGEEGSLTLATLDRLGNFAPARASIDLETDGDLRLPATVDLGKAGGGPVRLAVRAGREGVYRVRASGPAGLDAESNPLLVSRDASHVLWGDLHGHSGLSDGTGTPEDYLRYARDVAGLDVVALTDHDHWGMLFLDAHPEHWDEIRRAVEAFHAPGHFVTILGYEWTSWIYGHRHVLYFSGAGAVRSSLDPAFETPEQLWAALRGKPALTIAHHPAGGPIATDWTIPPDPTLEPVVEVVSVHGSSEAPDAPNRIYDPAPGHTAREALDRGYRLGFLGSGDSHDGHPGLAHVAGPSGGLAAIVAGERTREGVLAALRARRVYATSGARIGLDTTLDRAPMGAVLEAPGGVRPSARLRVRIRATAPVERVDIVRTGALAETIRGPFGRAVELERSLLALRTGEYVYVRVVQKDGMAAWSSPWFVGPPTPSP